MSLPIAFYPSALLSIPPHFFLTLPTTFYHSLLHCVLYNSPLRSITSCSFLSFPTTSYHFPPHPIIPYRFLSLSMCPIILHCSLLPPTASYHSAPLPITLHCVLLLPTTLYHSTPFPIPPNALYRCLPLAITPYSSRSLPTLLSFPTASWQFPPLTISLHLYLVLRSEV